MLHPVSAILAGSLLSYCLMGTPASGQAPSIGDDHAWFREKIEKEWQTYVIDLCNEAVVKELLRYLAVLDLKHSPEDQMIAKSLVHHAPLARMHQDNEILEAMLARIAAHPVLDVLDRVSMVYVPFAESCIKDAKKELAGYVGTPDEFAKPENLEMRRRIAREKLEASKLKE